MTRAATEGELLKLRSDGQKTDLYLTIHKPAVVYTALVNQTTFGDPVVQVAYDNGSGTLADVKIGMTLYVGSSAGAYDLGMVRIRKTPGAAIFYINEDSEIPWANNLYLTVVDEIGLWQKHLVMSGPVIYMDYDVSYTDQHKYLNPAPVMGANAVLWLDGDSVNFEPDAGDSWVLGSTISSYLWSAPGSSATSGLNTATPTITYNAAGTYRVSCTVTATNGKTTTGYRYVFVYDDDNLPATNFELLSCAGNYESGGWEFSVRMFDEADDVRDRSMVILHARDWYGLEEGSIGPIDGCENVIVMGWIAGESIHWDPEENYVTFDVRGPQAWFGQIPAYPVGVEYSGSDPTEWTSVLNLTVDKGLFHLLHWRSTATIMMDVILPGDTQYAPSVEAQVGNLWAQMTSIAEQMILAKPVCDRYGRLYVQVDTQYLGGSDRSEIPAVMTLTQDDLRENANITRETVQQAAHVEASGFAFNGSTATPLISKAPGRTYGRFGETIPVEQLLIPSQTRLNELAALIWARKNNPYPNVDLQLAANNRLVDVCPRQRLILSIGANDTVRGIVLVNQKLLPRRVEYEYDPNAGFLIVNVECEGETYTSVVGETIPYVPPPAIGTLPIGTLPDIRIPPLSPLPNITFPPYEPVDPQIPPEEGATCPTDAPANGPYDMHISGTVINTGSYYGQGKLRGMVRTSGHSNRTRYEINARWQELDGSTWVDTDDDSWYNVYALGPSGTVATGSKDAVTNSHKRTGTLDAGSVTLMDTLVVQLHSSLLVRPTGSPTAWFQRDFGALVPYVTGGASGGGYYALAYGNYSANNVWSWFRLSVKFPGISGPVLINQTAYASVVGATTSAISYLGGGYVYSPTNVTMYWGVGEPDVYGPTTLLSAAESYTMDENPYDGVGIQARYHWSGTHALTLYQTVHLYRPATKRIIIESVKLYNLCPPDA